MQRRRYLALVGTSVAGCVGRRSDATPVDEATSANTSRESGTPTETQPGTRTPGDPEQRVLESNEPYRTANGQVVRVSIYRAQRGIVEAGIVHDRPLVPDDRQFLQVGVETDGDDAPAPGELCLTANVEEKRSFDGCTARIEAVDGDRRGKLQAIPVPLEFDGDAAAIVWDRENGENVQWSVPDRTLADLRTLPEFVVEDLTVPETATDGEPFEVGITVRNDGGRKDWFVAELGPASLSDGRDLELPYDPGETRTVARELRASFGDGDEMLVKLDWDRDSIEKPVRRA